MTTSRESTSVVLRTSESTASARSWSNRRGAVRSTSRRWRGVGTIFEIGALLAELRSEKTAGTSSVAVVVPLKRGSAARARALVREGPPFDPAIRFERHHVFVSEREVVFVFEGEDVKRAVQA